MNLSGSKSRLQGLAKNITVRWAETQEHWHDARSENFGRHFMQELQPRVNQAAAAIEKLDELFNQIRKDCE